MDFHYRKHYANKSASLPGFPLDEKAKPYIIVM